MKWYNRLFNNGAARRGLLAAILVACGIAGPTAFMISDGVNDGIDAAVSQEAPGEPGAVEE